MQNASAKVGILIHNTQFIIHIFSSHAVFCYKLSDRWITSPGIMNYELGIMNYELGIMNYKYAP